jgi:DNA-binding transcriptional ArsR family regulator
MNGNSDHLARILKVLAVSTRVRIVQLLRERTLCVNALAARLDVTQGAVSQHLRVMRDADLVIDERRGYRVHYCLNHETLAQWRREIDALLAPPDQASPEGDTTSGERPCAAKRTNRDAGSPKT